jgi:hypothetical protein
MVKFQAHPGNVTNGLLDLRVIYLKREPIAINVITVITVDHC